MNFSLRDLGGHDPYDLLGVTRNAGEREIVVAHRQRVRLSHPDRPGGDEERTKLLHLARAILLDSGSRAEYDRLVGPAGDPAGHQAAAEQPAPSAEPPRQPTHPGDQPSSRPPGRDGQNGATVDASGGSPSPRYRARHARPTGPEWAMGRATRAASLSPTARFPLGATALVCAVILGPAGLVLGVAAPVCAAILPAGLLLGVVALSRNPVRGSSARLCALGAVWVSGLTTLGFAAMRVFGADG